MENATELSAVSSRKTFNLNDWVPPIMALGTWLFAMYQEAHGTHFVPDKWMITIILAPYGAQVYLSARRRVEDAIKRLPKKD